MILLGWVAIYKAGETQPGYGHSSGMMLPDDFATALFNGEELGPLLQAKIQEEGNHIPLKLSSR